MISSSVMAVYAFTTLAQLGILVALVLLLLLLVLVLVLLPLLFVDEDESCARDEVDFLLALLLSSESCA